MPGAARARDRGARRRRARDRARRRSPRSLLLGPLVFWLAWNVLNFAHAVGLPELGFWGIVLATLFLVVGWFRQGRDHGDRVPRRPVVVPRDRRRCAGPSRRSATSSRSRCSRCSRRGRTRTRTNAPAAPRCGTDHLPGLNEPADSLTLPFAWYSDEEDSGVSASGSSRAPGSTPGAQRGRRPGSFLARTRAASRSSSHASGRRAARVRQRLPPPRRRARPRAAAGARRSSATTTRGRTTSTDRCAPRPRSDREPGFDRPTVARPGERRHLGAVPVRQPRPRTPRRSRSGSATCRRSSRRDIDLDGSSSTRASRSARTRTGRS